MAPGKGVIILCPAPFQMSPLNTQRSLQGVMSTKEFLYKYQERIARYRRIIKELRNGDLALKFLDHLETAKNWIACYQNFGCFI